MWYDHQGVTPTIMLALQHQYNCLQTIGIDLQVNATNNLVVRLHTHWKEWHRQEEVKTQLSVVSQQQDDIAELDQFTDVVC